MSNKQPTSLVKFADADTAVKILTESKLRWSAPILFRDPFELDHRSSLNFDSKALLIACVKATLGLIFSRDDPRGNSPLLKAVRRWRTEERFDSEDEATDVLSELLASMVKQREPEIEHISEQWKKYSEQIRILCLSDNHENAVLWKRYASNHSGLAMRFACGDDTSLENPQPVSYSDIKPEISPISEQMEILMNQIEVKVEDSFPDKYLSKAKSESLEKEWRLIKNDSNMDTSEESQWFEEVGFEAGDLRAVYLGAAMSEDTKNQVKTLLNQQFPKTKVFQASTLINRYELKFERLRN